MSSLEGSLVPVEGTSLQEISIPTDNHVTLQRNSHGITSKHVSKQPCAYVGLPKTVSNTPAVRVTTACSDVWITRKNTPSKTHRVSKGFHIYVFDGDTLHLIAPGTKLPQVGYTVRVKASVHKKQKVEQPTQPVSTLCLTGKHLLLLGDFAEKKTHLVLSHGGAVVDTLSALHPKQPPLAQSQPPLPLQSQSQSQSQPQQNQQQQQQQKQHQQHTRGRDLLIAVDSGMAASAIWKYVQRKHRMEDGSSNAQWLRCSPTTPSSLLAAFSTALPPSWSFLLVKYEYIGKSMWENTLLEDPTPYLWYDPTCHANPNTPLTLSPPAAAGNQSTAGTQTAMMIPAAAEGTQTTMSLSPQAAAGTQAAGTPPTFMPPPTSTPVSPNGPPSPTSPSTITTSVTIGTQNTNTAAGTQSTPQKPSPVPLSQPSPQPLSQPSPQPSPSTQQPSTNQQQASPSTQQPSTNRQASSQQRDEEQDRMRRLQAIRSIRPPHHHNNNTRPVTAGDAGLTWGTGCVWTEPYDEASAMETYDTLMCAYNRVGKYRKTPHVKKRRRSSAATPTRGVKKTTQALPGGMITATQETRTQEEEDGGSDPEHWEVEEELGVGERRSTCSHSGCAAQVFCFKEQFDMLNEIMQHEKGTHDYHFRQRGNKLAGDLLSAHRNPIKTAADVNQVLGLGEKSRMKATCLVLQGYLPQLKEARAEGAEVVAEFRQVWGAGNITADSWYYDHKCRSLEDVKNKVPNLTSQQKIGLEFFHDFKQRIPRAEVAQIEHIIRHHVFEVLREAKYDPDTLPGLFCGALGSFARGLADSGDIDMLVVLPTDPIIAPGWVMRTLLHRLVTAHVLLDRGDWAKPYHDDHCAPASHTFLGVCKVEGVSPVARRVDVKIYPSTMRATAVNYFVGSGMCCRWLRYYAKFKVANIAKQHHPEATGFRISDKGVWPIAVRHDRNWRNPKDPPANYIEKKEVGHRTVIYTFDPIEVHCETDIYKLLGLAYLPWWWRSAQ